MARALAHTGECAAGPVSLRTPRVSHPQLLVGRFFIAMIGLKIGQITRITVNIPAIVIAPDAFTNLGA